MSDPVNHPSHYTFGRFEVIDVLLDWFPDNPLLWQVGKYIARCGRKGDAVEDLKKARFYLDREIARLEERRSYESTRAKAEELYANDAGGPLSAADETVQRHYMKQAACC